jgi:hypothetical protein
LKRELRVEGQAMRRGDAFGLLRVFYDARTLGKLEGLRLGGCERMHLLNMSVEITGGAGHITAGWTRQLFVATSRTAFGRRIGLGWERDKLSHALV